LIPEKLLQTDAFMDREGAAMLFQIQDGEDNLTGIPAVNILYSQQKPQSLKDKELGLQLGQELAVTIISG